MNTTFNSLRIHRTIGQVALLVVCLVGLSLALAPAVRAVAPATTFTVNSTVDATDANPGDGLCAMPEGGCTLRAGIQEANTLGGPYTYTIILPAGVYILTIPGPYEDMSVTGDLDIRARINLQGAGAEQTIIDGNHTVTNDRVLDIPLEKRVTVTGLTIRNGQAEVGGGIRGSSGRLGISDCVLVDNRAVGNGGTGGAISTIGGYVVIRHSKLTNNYASWEGGVYSGFLSDITIKGSTLVGNSAGSNGGAIAGSDVVSIHTSILSDNRAGAHGGAIYQQGGGSATVVITDSTLDGNWATHGGAIYTYYLGDVNLYDSSLTNNTATFGGAVYDYYFATVTATNVTLSANTALVGGGIYVQENASLQLFNATVSGNKAEMGGGLYNQTSVTTMRNTLLAGNTGSSPDCYGSVTSDGYNLLGNNSGCDFTPAAGDQIGTPDNPIDPLLGPLQDNGGPTLTHALLPGSPAVDAGDPAGCTDDQGNLLTTDQRGFERPQDGDGNGSVICDVGAFEAESAGLFALFRR
ncbi:MAG: choice-of-anchor Q domain-containing protein [Chloroflexota bacterium]